MHITAITVTAEDGTLHTWEGSIGHISFIDLRESGGSKSAPGRLYGKLVNASLVIPPEGQPRVVRRSAVSGEFTTAEDAAAHPDTTVTEQVDG